MDTVDSIKDLILTDIHTIMGNFILTSASGAPFFKTVEVDKFTIVDLENVDLPSCFIFSSTEQRHDGTIGFETWDWEVVLEVWGINFPTNELIGALNDKMFENRRFGEKALSCVRTGSTQYFIDSEKQIQGLLVPFSIIYRHKIGHSDKQ